MSDKTTQPNIVLIMTDQQRFDTIREMGHGHMITPNLDKLVREGRGFTHCFAAGATCVVARAAMFTGMYAHNTGVFGFNKWAHHRSWVSDLQDAGYHTVNIGKMHVMPFFEQQAFDERIVVENPTTNFAASGGPDDAWGDHLTANDAERPFDRHRKDPAWYQKHQGVAWEMEEHLHPDVFVGDKALDFIQGFEGGKPLFLQVGFTGPHEPYDPLPRHLALYDDIPVPQAIFRENELGEKPPQHRVHGEFNAITDHESTIDLSAATGDEISRMRRHYYANVTTIDEKIGEILDALEQQGLLENTVLIFTSDHGDMLGDHRLPYKWLMYEPIVRVPLIVCGVPTEQLPETDALISQMDIGPTLLKLAGCEIPRFLEGRPDLGLGNAEEAVFAEDNYLTMVRTRTHKYVHYTFDEAEGELYDLRSDPAELVNLFHDPDQAAVVTEMRLTLLNWLSRSTYQTSVYRNDAGPKNPVWPLMPADDRFLHFRPKSMPDGWNVHQRKNADASEN